MNKRSSGSSRRLRSAIRAKLQSPFGASSAQRWLPRLLFLGSVSAFSAIAISAMITPLGNVFSLPSSGKVIAQTATPASLSQITLPTATAPSIYLPQVAPKAKTVAAIEAGRQPEGQSDEQSEVKSEGRLEGRLEGRSDAKSERQSDVKSEEQLEAKLDSKSAQKLSRYILEFNRSPVIGDRFRLEGTHDESPFNFTRPRSWNVKSAKAVVRFQHSPGLIADRSNLVLRVNDTSIGSVPLNLKNAQIGEASFNIPTKLLQDENQVTIVAQQQNSPTCSNPDDKQLWSEVLADSKIEFNYDVKPTELEFSRYPYPFFDQYGLDSNRVSYLVPSTISDTWLTAASRFQTSFGRLAEFRPLETVLIKDLKQTQWNDRIVIIGTPEEQPLLKSLPLPYKIVNNAIVDGDRKPLSDATGLVMMTTNGKDGVPVLIVSGNSADGVRKAAQFLIQPSNSQIGTGNAIVVSELSDPPSPSARQWAHYLPEQDAFKLSDLRGVDHKPFQDKTVRGTSAAPVQFNFRALPDDRFLRGSSMNLMYSYSAQVNPRLSSVSVRLDGVGIGSRKLDSEQGKQRESMMVDLPASLVKPNSVIDVSFDLYPNDAAQCGYANDQQLWGSVHGDTTFHVKRENSVRLPDLKLLTMGFPIAAPQDLSKTAIAVPDAPNETDIMTLLKFSERMGRISYAPSVKVEVFKASALPEDVRRDRHIVAIGTRDRFPVQQAFEVGAFRLMDVFGRSLGQDRIQTLPDASGVIKSVMSPWNGDRVLIALSGQTEAGLKQIQDILSQDPWFYQLKKDTVLINANPQRQSPFDANAYQLQFLDQAEHRRIENVSLLGKARYFLENQWYVLPLGIITIALLLYGVAQVFLKRIAG